MKNILSWFFYFMILPGHGNWHELFRCFPALCVDVDNSGDGFLVWVNELTMNFIHQKNNNTHISRSLALSTELAPRIRLKEVYSSNSSNACTC